MLKLDSEIDISKFFKWWGDELSFLLPEKFREALTKGKSLLIVEINNKKARLSFANSEEEKHIGEFDVDALADDDIEDLIESNPLYKDVEIVLRVPEQLSIKQEVFLPAAAEANLHQVITYELDRFTPFNKDQVYFDFIKPEQEKNKTHIQLILVLVKKETLDYLYESCVTLGLKPSFSDSATQVVEPGKASSRYNLLPQYLCQKADKRPLYIMLASFVLPLLLLAFLLIYPLYKSSSGLEKLKFHSRSVEKTAIEIEDSKRGIDYLYQATQKVIDKKNSSPSMIDVIDTVSKVLGDDTWVSRLQYSNNTLQLTGQSGSASNIIGALEETRFFYNVKFTSPVTKDSRTGLDRFRISSSVKDEQEEEEQSDTEAE
jgi:general secretion pathway protein L